MELAVVAAGAAQLPGSLQHVAVAVAGSEVGVPARESPLAVAQGRYADG